MTCKCPNSKCDAPAKYLPVMLLYPPRKLFRRSPPARSIVGIAVCEAHRASISLDFLLTDAGFDQIVKAFELMGKVPPERAATVLEFIDIDSGEARSFLSASRASNN